MSDPVEQLGGGSPTADPSPVGRPGSHRAPVIVATLMALAVGIAQFRNGVVHLLDTVTYWSGIDSFAHGHPLRTGLAPSFSNFSAAEFADRGGDLPFVDFPIGYTVVAGVIAWITDARRAMEIVCLASLAVIAALTVTVDRRTGVDRRAGRSRAWVVAAFAVLLFTTPAMRLVTQGALSEPLFCAVAVALVATLARYRNGGSFTPVAVLASSIGLLRFIGAPLAVVAGWEMWRRTHDRARSVLVTALLLVPTTLNILGARVAGGGHGAGWRGLDRTDLEVTVRSIGGWFDARQGDIRRTYFSDDGPAWWSWPVALLWLVLVAVAVLVFLVGRRGGVGDGGAEPTRWGRYTRWLSSPSELALVCAGAIWVGLIAGMAGFDALVIADNRLMLPVGVLTLLAVVWSIPHRWVLAGGVVVFAAAAARPWNATQSFADNDEGDLVSAAALLSGARLIISNNADAVHWDTGLPAAYVPLPVKPLTGEVVDVEFEYDALPCALLRADGAVVISNTATFSAARLDLLDAEAEVGRLVVEQYDGAVVYFPTDSACD